MNNYGNRGMDFEELIKYINERYKQSGDAVIEKQNTLCKAIRDKTGRIVNAKYDEKSTVDFLGRFGETPIAFEAKSAAGDHFYLNRVEKHQREFLDTWTSDEAIGFVFITFGMSRFFVIPWEVYSCLFDSAGKNVIIIWRSINWSFSGKKSIKASEIPKEFESGIDYLKTVYRLYFTDRRKSDE